MRARWEALHESLIRSATTLKSTQKYRQACQTTVLSRYESPSDLIEFLTSHAGDLDAKDAMYAALVRATQSRSHWAELASTILWCGLWPGLDNIYRHRQRYFRDDPEELVAAISTAFTKLVARVDLRRVHRVAATLVRSTDRDLMEGQRRRLAERQREHVPQEDGELPSEREPEMARGRESNLGVQVGLSFDGEFEVLRARLLPIAGRDTDLLVAVAVLEENQREAAERVGVTHEVARKRFQKTLSLVRTELGKGISQFDARGPRLGSEGPSGTEGGTD